MTRTCPFENSGHKKFSNRILTKPNKPWRSSILRLCTSLNVDICI